MMMGEVHECIKGFGFEMVVKKKIAINEMSSLF